MSLKKYKSLTSLTLKNIVRRRLRSSLTILSVMIGIGAVIALVLLSDGLFNAIEGQFNQMGTNTIMVVPINFGGGGMSGPMGESQRLGDDVKLTLSDSKNIEKISGVTEVIPFSFKMSKLEFANEEQYKTVYIVKEDQADKTIEIMNMKLRAGTGLTNKEGRKIIIGTLVADDMFKRKIKVGDTINVDNLDFKVVGIMEYIGNEQDDSSIYMTREMAQEVYELEDQVDEIFIKTNPLDDILLIKDKIVKKLEKTHEKNTFIVITATQILEIIKSILNVLKIILTAIAGISIVVGAIGIMNSIYTSVLERTKEIGVLKAIGAHPKDINYIFISESIILSFIGGVLGILLGIGIAKAVEWYALSQNFTMLTIAITGEVILLGLGLALLTGILSGVLPARRAEHMNTVDALRNKM